VLAHDYHEKLGFKHNQGAGANPCFWRDSRFGN
jgi:hypothetical protein